MLKIGHAPDSGCNLQFQGTACAQMGTGAVVQELKHSGAHPVLASGWGPVGQPLVSCEKNGTVTFWGST